MSVVGFDVGSKASFVAVARQGGVETVANEYSARATPSYVSFGQTQRALGTSAQQQVIMNLKNTVWLFKHLIGRPFADILVERYQDFIPYKLVEVEATKRCGVLVEHCELEYCFSMEQILAMLLGKLRNIASTNLDNRPVSDCVICCPFYLTSAERAAWQEAAKIANLNVLRLMNETTAVALSYGIFKTNLPETDQQPTRVAFVDIGYTQTQATIAAFHKGSLKIIAASADRNLGGLDFDRLLLEHFAEEFKGKYKIDVMTNKRAQLRLLTECEKLKKLMSANNTPCQLNVECIMNDKDVSGKLSRAEFEEKCQAAGYWDRLSGVLMDLKSQVPDLQLDSVEIIGGSSRVPKVKEIIQEVFKMEPNTTLNADEAVARGAALQCAILSPAFRVREFNIQDLQAHSIRIDWKGADGKPGNALIFDKNENVPLSKVLTFTRKDVSPFTIEARYHQDNFSYFPEKNIGQFTIDGLKTPSIPEENKTLKVKVKLRVDNHGQLIVPQAVQIDKQMVQEKLEKEASKSEEKPSTPLPDPASDDQPKEEEKKEEGDKKDEKEEKKEKTKMVAKSVKVELNVKSDYVGILDHRLLDKYIQLEGELEILDKKERERQDAKNAVEEFVYDQRTKLGELYEQFSTDQEKDALRSELTQTEDWLYEDGENEKRPVYEEKLTHLKNQMSKIHTRYHEFEKRGPLIEKLAVQIQKCEKFVQKYTSMDESVAHIEATQVEKVTKTVTEARTWYEQTMNKINSQKKSDDPAVFSSEIQDNANKLKNDSDKIMDTPKPKPPTEEPEKEPEVPKDAAPQDKTEPENTETEKNGDATEENDLPTAPMDVD